MAAIAAAGIGLFGSIISSRGKKSGGAPAFNPAQINAGGLRSTFDPNTNLVSVAGTSTNAAKIAEIDRRIAALTAQQGRSSIQDSRREERGGQIRPAADPAIAQEIASLNAQRAALVASDAPGARQSLVNQQSALFGLQAQEIAGLRAQVAPGFGKLSQAQASIFSGARDRLGNRRREAVGNLRQNLSLRRVLGSSFADDAISRQSLSFEAEERDLIAQQNAAAAEAIIREIGISDQLLAEQYQAQVSQFQTSLDELNLQTNIALTLATGAQAELGQNARVTAALNANAAGQSGEFFGGALERLLGAISNSTTPAPIQTDAAGRVLGGV